MKRYFVSKCDDRDLVGSATKAHSWDVMERVGFPKRRDEAAAYSNHDTRAEAQAEARRLNQLDAAGLERA